MLDLAWSGVQESVMAIIGGFPNQTFANQKTKTIRKDVIEP